MPAPAMPAAHTAAPGTAEAASGTLPQHAPLVVATRDGLVESVHYGSAIATAPDGSTVATAGNPMAPFYPRSSLKPLQAVAMVRAGLNLPADLLALSAASHSGAAIHRGGTQRILAMHGSLPATWRTAQTSPMAAQSARTGCDPVSTPPS